MNRESERKRLVELIDNFNQEKFCINLKISILEKYADYLLDNGIVVPPVKVGDEVFCVHEICDENGDEHLDISVGKCEGVSLQKDGIWIYCRYEDGLSYWHKNDKTVFTSREEALAKLKGEDK